MSTWIQALARRRETPLDQPSVATERPRPQPVPAPESDPLVQISFAARFSTRKRMFKVARDQDVTLKALILRLAGEIPHARHRGCGPDRSEGKALTWLSLRRAWGFAVRSGGDIMFMFEIAGGIILAVLSAVTLALLGVAAWASVLFAREAQSSDWIAAGEFTAILIVGLILYVLLRRIRQSRTADRPAVD